MPVPEFACFRERFINIMSKRPRVVVIEKGYLKKSGRETRRTTCATLRLIAQWAFSPPYRNALGTATVRAMPHAIDIIRVLSIHELLLFRLSLELLCPLG